MVTYALDTNIIIHYLRDEPNVIQNLENSVNNRNDIVIPRIVEYEIRRGFKVQPAPRKESHYDLLSRGTEFCSVVNMGDSFWRTAAQVYVDLYHKRFTVGDIDILIAAFCMYKGYTLVTNNTDDFKNIDGLKNVYDIWLKHKKHKSPHS